jgi:hypothetical protein
MVRALRHRADSLEQTRSPARARIKKSAGMQGNQGPWDPTLNPTFDYEYQEAIKVAYVSGLVNVFPEGGFPNTNANGRPFPAKVYTEQIWIPERNAMRKPLLMSIVYLSWVAYAGGLAYLGWRGHWVVGLAWLVGVPLMQWVYRELPMLSPPGKIAGRADVSIAAYPRPGCKSCTVLQERVEDLKRQLSV